MPSSLRSRLSAKSCLLLAIIMTACLGSDRIVDQQLSPDGRYKAQLVEGDTGAVGGWVSIVWVTDLHPILTARLLSSNRKTVLGVDMRAEHIKLQWKTAANLEVICTACDLTKVEVKENVWRGVDVTYVSN